MQACWNTDPADRPAFAQIRTSLMHHPSSMLQGEAPACHDFDCSFLSDVEVCFEESRVRTSSFTAGPSQEQMQPMPPDWDLLIAEPVLCSDIVSDSSSVDENPRDGCVRVTGDFHSAISPSKPLQSMVTASTDALLGAEADKEYTCESESATSLSIS